MRRYETISILRPSLNEEEISAITSVTTDIIANDGGRIIELDRWGMKKLAYSIKKENQGYYVFCDYSATPEAVAEIERKFRIDDAVLRYINVQLADSITDDGITEATAQAANKQTVATEDAEDDSIDDADDSDDSSDEDAAEDK